MITLKDYMELIDYKITEGSEWYGNIPNTYCLTTWNGDQDGYSLNCVFDPTNNQKVYLVEVCDYKNQRAYRLVDPSFDKDDEAWDNVSYVDLEDDNDFIQKAQAIIAGEEYDTRVSIPIELSDAELLKFMTIAHERDITFNQLVEEALWEAIHKHNNIKYDYQVNDDQIKNYD